MAMRETLPLRHDLPLEERLCRRVCEALRQGVDMIRELGYEPSEEARGYDMWRDSVQETWDVMVRQGRIKEDGGDA